MSLTTLTEEEQSVVKRTMEATFKFFDFDFHSRLGVTTDEMKALLLNWPNVDDSDSNQIATVAINNSLNDLLHGEGIDDEKAIMMIGVDRDEMLRVYRKWARNRGWSSTGVM